MRLPHILVPSFTFLLALAAAPPAVAGIVYADASLSSGANNGTSWANAFQGPSGLEQALAVAVSGDQIWVADGTYLPTLGGNRTIPLDLKSGVAVYGGFAGTETSLSQRIPALYIAVLSGDLEGDDPANVADNSLHVVRATFVGSGALLDGFTIRGGNAEGDSGGGLLVDNSFVSIRRCVFEGNRCTGLGGAALVDLLTQGSAAFEDCRFVGNQAGTGGGAVALSEIEYVSFDRCIFSGNTAQDGGAVWFRGGLDAVFAECLFYGNTATGSGGGGAIWGRFSGAFENYVWLSDSTVAANTSTVAATAGLVFTGQIQNSIVYFNTGPGGAQGLANQLASGIPWEYSCVQGGGTGATGRIDADPQFLFAPGGNFRLADTSPCVDSGSNSDVPLSSVFDLDLTPRLEDVPGAPDTGSGTPPIVDMGAYETAANPPFQSFCAGDGSLATACPCGNTGAAGHGCRHSAVWSTGALLTATGTVTPDTATMTASDLRAGVLCLFLQGNAPIQSGAVFGDGVRCVGGTLKRIGIKNANSGGWAVYPASGDASISVRSAVLGDPIQGGTRRWYQAWYRDNSSTFCPPPQGGTSNITSGMIVNW